MNMKAVFPFETSVCTSRHDAASHKTLTETLVFKNDGSVNASNLMRDSEIAHPVFLLCVKNHARDLS